MIATEVRVCITFKIFEAFFTATLRIISRNFSSKFLSIFFLKMHIYEIFFTKIWRFFLKLCEIFLRKLRLFFSGGKIMSSKFSWCIATNIQRFSEVFIFIYPVRSLKILLEIAPRFLQKVLHLLLKIYSNLNSKILSDIFQMTL